MHEDIIKFKKSKYILRKIYREKLILKKVSGKKLSNFRQDADIKIRSKLN